MEVRLSDGRIAAYEVIGGELDLIGRPAQSRQIAPRVPIAELLSPPRVRRLPRARAATLLPRHRAGLVRATSGTSPELVVGRVLGILPTLQSRLAQRGAYAQR